MGSSRRLLIVTYHRVVNEPDRYGLGEVDSAQFNMHIQTFARFFNVLDLGDAFDRLQRGGLPRRAVVITFDDGYKDNIAVALPILRRWQVPATFFIATGYLDGSAMWNDILIEAVKKFSGSTIELGEMNLGRYSVRSDAERGIVIGSLLEKIKYLPTFERDAQSLAVSRILGAEVPVELMMNENDVRLLVKAGMGVGAHTRTHPILRGISEAEALSEIAGSKEDLEAIGGQSVECFAYPNGKPGQDFDYRHEEMVRESGYKLAVSTNPVTVDNMSNRFQLGRFNVWDRSRAKLIVRSLMRYRH